MEQKAEHLRPSTRVAGIHLKTLSEPSHEPDGSICRHQHFRYLRGIEIVATNKLNHVSTVWSQ